MADYKTENAPHEKRRTQRERGGGQDETKAPLVVRYQKE